MGDEHADPVVVEEWRVTGDPTITHPDGRVQKFPGYSFAWTSDRMYDDRGRAEGIEELTAEQAARRFCEQSALRWADGPHLHHRTVTYSPWEAASL